VWGRAHRERLLSHRVLTAGSQLVAGAAPTHRSDAQGDTTRVFALSQGDSANTRTMALQLQQRIPGGPLPRPSAYKFL
jgi:hypothetical protein